MLHVTSEVKIYLSEIEFSYVRSAGPGGQNVNKVASKAVLRWNMGASNALNDEQKRRLARLFPSFVTKEGEVVITSQLTRDAPKNREDCLHKLCKMVKKAVFVPKRRIPTRPSLGSVKRRLDEKSRKSEKIKRRKINFE
ncbi:MAG: alternative ribosome rescue aminoacyl-tRNA hydrolase ArfB [Planctomycetia bacterium]|nr:alternative ribosome rescue aminoacyl-tRNA hydrolase ArfB [Planctomycetia bacterium]